MASQGTPLSSPTLTMVCMCVVQCAVGRNGHSPTQQKQAASQSARGMAGGRQAGRCASNTADQERAPPCASSEQAESPTELDPRQIATLAFNNNWHAGAPGDVPLSKLFPVLSLCQHPRKRTSGDPQSKLPQPKLPLPHLST
jgi:hypothetical protein